MSRYNLVILLFCMGSLAFSQDRTEREHRILKSQFPMVQIDLSTLGKRPKKVRYYKEVSDSETTYSLKFKMDRLYYHLDHDPEGRLRTAGFQIKEIDIPAETLAKIKKYLDGNFERTKIKRIFQEYPVDPQNEEQERNTLKSTFQNLLLPNITYKIVLRGLKTGLKMEDYELWFDGGGGFFRLRTALPANYDRILY